MTEEDQLLHRYAASLNDDNGNPIGFVGMEDIRQPYRARARLLSALRIICLIVLGSVFIRTAIQFVAGNGTSIIGPLMAFCAIVAAYFSPLFYGRLGAKSRASRITERAQKTARSIG